MTWFCTKCGSQNEDSEDVCIVCGSGKISVVETGAEVRLQESQQAPPPQGSAPQPPVQEKSQKVESPPPENESFLEIQFVQTPVEGLMGKKVRVNFSVFPAVSVGRSPENVLQIPDGSVSRMHAKIVLDGGSYYLEDVGSSNGSFLYDGVKFVEIKEKTKIAEKSLIKFGEGTIIKVTSLNAV